MRRTSNQHGSNGAAQQPKPSKMILERAKSFESVMLQTFAMKPQPTYRRAKTSTGVIRPSDDTSGAPQRLSLLKKYRENHKTSSVSSSIDEVQDPSVLDLTTIPFQGGTDELRKLRSVYTESLCGKVKARAMVQGYAGTGKSALIKEFLQGDTRQKAREGSIICYCSFQEDQASALSTIAASFANLLGQAQDRDPDTLGRAFSEESICNLKRLAHAFPNSIGQQISSMFLRQADFTLSTSSIHASITLAKASVHASSNHDTTSPNGGGRGFRKVDVSFRDLLRAICQSFHVVFVLEDLHHMGHEAAQIIRILWTDPEIRNILFLGSRSLPSQKVNAPRNEAKNAYRVQAPLSILDSLEDPASSVVVLHLQDWDQVQTAKLLHKILRLTEGHTDVDSLADLVRQKTGGNAALVVEYVRVLYKQEMIYWHAPTFSWKWDLDTIRANTDIADSVLELIAERLTTLPKDIVPILSIASFIGSMEFDAKIVQQTLQVSDAVAKLHSFHALMTGSPSLDALESKLKVAVEKGVLEQNRMEKKDTGDEEKESDDGSGHMYKFSHRKLWASARKIIPKGSIMEATLHYHVGRQLRGYYNLEVARPNHCPDLADKLLQIAIHHSNLGASMMTTAGERLEVVELNEKAALVAKQMWSYSAALQHLENALSFLPQDRQEKQPQGESWSSRDYDLLLRLNQTKVKVLMASGQLEQAITVGREVQHNARAVQDKCSVSFDLIYSLLENNETKEAMQTNISILKELGHQVPRRFLKMNIIRLLMRVQKKLKKLDEGHWLGLPAVYEESDFQTAELLRMLGDIALRAGNFLYKALGALLFTQANIKCGCQRLAQMTVAFAAYFHAVVGDTKEAIRYSKICTKLVQAYPQYQYENNIALTILTGYVDHQYKSYAECLDSSLQAYQLALNCGNTQSIIFNMIVYSVTYFHSGLALEPLYKDMHQFMKLLQDFGQKRSCLLFRPFLQFVAHLTNADSSIQRIGERDRAGSNFVGSILTQDHLDELLEQPDNARPLHYYRISTMILAYLFGNLETADAMSQSLCPEKEDGPIVWLAPRFLYQGLVAFGLGHKRRGKYFLRKLKALVRKGNPNCHHMYLLLKAEQVSLTCSPSNTAKIRTAFDAAIRASQRLGYLHHAALANERAGECLLESDEPAAWAWAKSYIMNAFELYGQWGATTKRRQLIELYDEDTSSQSLSASLTYMSESFGGSLRARARVTEETIAKEREVSSRNVIFLSVRKPNLDPHEPALMSRVFQIPTLEENESTEIVEPLSNSSCSAGGPVSSVGRRGGRDGFGRRKWRGAALTTSTKQPKSRRELLSKQKSIRNLGRSRRNLQVSLRSLDTASFHHSRDRLCLDFSSAFSLSTQKEEE